MDLKAAKSSSSGPVTPVKDSSKLRNSENFNPNLSCPASKNSPASKSASKTQKSAARKCSPNPVFSPPNKHKIRERKFIVAKKNPKRDKTAPSSSAATVVCKCGNKGHKCVCLAYESLRASQEEFFKNRSPAIDDDEDESGLKEDESGLKEDEVFDESPEKQEQNGDEGSGEVVPTSSVIKRRRDKLMEAARESVPETGSGRVLHLVKAFEKLLSIPKSSDSEEKEKKETEDTQMGMKWALPGLQQNPNAVQETRVSSSSFCPSDFLLTSESLGLDSCVSSSLDSSRGSFTISSRTGGGRRSRRNSAESSGTFVSRKQWKRKQQKATSLKPFKLRTEQRGSCKQEEFLKKVKQMMEEQEKLRIPIAQGLPWTTDEPECLVKPPVKDITIPVDLMLHSDVRAVERAEFDHQVSEKLSLIEEYKMERERQQKLEEEEEIRRLRRELVPKAQPMPYFDRPFIPRRSSKHPTIPKDPKFHIPQHKKIKCFMSLDDFYPEQHHN